MNKKDILSGSVFLLFLVILLVGLLQAADLPKQETDTLYTYKKDVIIEETELDENIAEEILEQTEKRENLDLSLLMALLEQESNFDPGAVGPKGARGIGQVMPSTGRSAAEKIGIPEYSDEKLFDPETNIRITCYYLNKRIEEYDGNYHKALTAYNRGVEKMQRFVETHGTAETSFSRDVLNIKEEWEDEFDPE